MASADFGTKHDLSPQDGRSDNEMQRNAVVERNEMLRVIKCEERSRTVFIVEGRLSADYVQVIETCCNEAMSTGTIVHLYLREVSIVDCAGRALLSRLVAKGVHLRARGVYVSHLIRELTATTEKSAKRGQGRDQEACGQPGTDSLSED